MNRTGGLGFVVALAFVIRLVGCTAPSSPAAGASDAGVPDDATDGVDAGAFDAADVADACAALARARCGKLASCSAWLFKKTYADEAQCESRDVLRCPLGAPGSSDTPDSVRACAAAYAPFDCSGFLTAEGVGVAITPGGAPEAQEWIMGGIPPVCAPRPGSLPHATGTPPMGGATCAFDSQCDSAYCKTNYAQACGYCAQPLRAGQSCEDDSSTIFYFHCPVGLVCWPTGSGSGSPWTCHAPGGPGHACGPSTGPCVAGLSCSNATGTCQPAAQTAGAACAPNGPDCDALQGLRCNPSHVCESIPLVPPGQNCGPPAVGGWIDCGAGGLCKADLCGAPCIEPCIAPVADGATCTGNQLPMGYVPCVSPAVCDSAFQTCRITNAANCPPGGP